MVLAMYFISCKKPHRVIIQILHAVLQHGSPIQSLFAAPFFMSLPSGDGRILLRYL